ncbi:MAG: sigma-70 family RNA polymerase sigma factor [Cyanobacteria bacterium NC_groundwater_1444_Ag_S-0.65um_54_12]|nr:sigma-70 family RNA polymerase sigma factor [Cyanobacteria bacterium NC_groundwater_1444_Ag_S-0.65um_54_12]
MLASDQIDNAALILEYQNNRCSCLREALVKRYLKLVAAIARVYANRSEIAVEDLVQVGSIGLLHAIERFELAAGHSFESYAGACIAGEIRHYLRDHGQLIKLPRELQELRPKVLSITTRLAQTLQRTPTAQEIASELNVVVEKVEEVFAIEARGAPLSLDDDSPGDQESAGWRYQLIDNRYHSFQLSAEDRIMLGQAMDRLRQVSREVIEFTFYQDLTQIEIAKKLGISQMQVSRRIRTALSELWKVLNTPLGLR